MREQRIFIFSDNSRVCIQTKNTYCGPKSTFQVVKKRNTLNDGKTLIPALPKENYISDKKKIYVLELLKIITISETAQQYYDKALSGTKEGDEDNKIVVYDEQEPFIKS